MAGELPRTYGDLLARDDEARWELIDGQAYAMTGPSWQHQHVVAVLIVQLYAYFGPRGCRVLPAPFDVRLARADERDDSIATVLQPDISVVCDLSKLDARGCRGAPELVVEVLSPTSLSRDNIQKRAIYELHGVKQYWLVHPLDQLATIYRLDGAEFGKPDIFDTRGVIAIAGYDGLEIDWDQIFSDLT